jgi:hypothetical protein
MAAVGGEAVVEMATMAVLLTHRGAFAAATGRAMRVRQEEGLEMSTKEVPTGEGPIMAEGPTGGLGLSSGLGFLKVPQQQWRQLKQEGPGGDKEGTKQRLHLPTTTSDIRANTGAVVNSSSSSRATESAGAAAVAVVAAAAAAAAVAATTAVTTAAAPPQKQQRQTGDLILGKQTPVPTFQPHLLLLLLLLGPC